MKKNIRKHLKGYFFMLLFFIALLITLKMITKDYLSDKEILKLYYGISTFIVIGSVIFNHLYHSHYKNKMKVAMKLLEDNKTDEYIEVLHELLRKAKGNFLKTLFTINLSVGYCDKKDYEKCIELLESISNKRMYYDVKMCYRLNLCCSYYYSNQTEKAKEIYNQSQKIFKPFKENSIYGGNLAVLDMFMELADENYDVVDEQLRIAKEKWTNPRFQEDYDYIEKILNEHIQERTLIYEEISDNGKYKFEIYEAENSKYDVWLLYFDEEREDYFNLNDDRHIIDSLERAKELGRILIAQVEKKEEIWKRLLS